MRARFFFLVVSCGLGCARTPTETPTTRDEPVATQAPTSTKNCDENRIRLLLSAPHDPPTRAELASACANPVPLLVGFATDTSLRGLLRLRSIEALGHFGGSDAKRTLSERATASGELASVRRASLAALLEASTDDATTRESIGVRALSDPDGHVRVAAVRLLHGLRTHAVSVALEQARAKETETFVRSEIERELAP